MEVVNRKKIKELREAAGLSKVALGEAVGVSHVMIIHIEQGLKSPSVALLQRIARYFGCTVDELICDPDRNAG